MPTAVAIAQGLFHNDVIAVGNGDVLLSPAAFLLALEMQAALEELRTILGLPELYAF